MKINNWFGVLASSITPTGLEEDMVMEEEIGKAPRRLVTREKKSPLLRDVSTNPKLKPKSKGKNAN
jgi:hypothetical protein